MIIQAKKFLHYWWLLAFILGFCVVELSIAIWLFLDELTHSIEMFSAQGLQTFADCLRAALFFAVPAGFIAVLLAGIGILIYRSFKNDQNS